MPDLLLFATVFFAFFTLSLTGFGHALIAMPLLGPLLGIPVAAPLVALLSLTGESLMILRYRAQFNPRAVWRLIAAALVGILIGVRLVALLDARLVLALLGLVTGGYALYALLDLRLPHLTGGNWAFPFGFVSGLLSGAYNTGGPPAVIYASLARWPPAEFKMRLQSLFITSTITVVLTHAASGNLTPAVLASYALGLPALLLGLALGFRLEKRIHPAQFRRLVLILLVVVGARLLIASLSA